MTIKRYKQLISLVAGLAMIVLILTIRLYWQEHNKPNVEVVFLDIGQGDSILIKTKYNQQILIDGGPDNKVLDRLGRNLPFYDHDLDIVIATHPDAEHVAGLVSVPERYKVGLFLGGGLVHDTAIYKALGEMVQQKQIPARFVASRQVYDLGDNLFLDILYPNTSFVGQDIKDNNNASIIAKLTDGEVDYLFTGDATVETESELIKAYGAYLNSEILKVGHHGSRTSTGDLFLQAVSPEAAVIQVGKQNRYGHPSAVILDRLGALNIPIFRNDELGDIKMVSDGESVELK